MSKTDQIFIFEGLIPIRSDLVMEGLPQSYLVFSREENPYDHTWSEWVERWWRWCASHPASLNPVSDRTGEMCGKDQDDPTVWFLTGTFGGTAFRHCTITREKAIFFPLVNDLISFAEYGELETDQDLHDYAKADLDTAHCLRTSIDGTNLPNLEKYRVHSSVFELNVFIPGLGTVKTKAVSDGYWMFLHPLPPGYHNISFGGEKAQFDEFQHGSDTPVAKIPNFQVRVTYDIIVE